MENKSKILKKLLIIQEKLKVHKGRNVMKRYNYRSQDDILEAVKPILKETETVLIVSDEIIHFEDRSVNTIDDSMNKLDITKKSKKSEKGYVEVSTDNSKDKKSIKQKSESRFYIKATARLYDAESGEFIESTANAREETERYGMDVAQLTGSSSSYARKYCLGGLFGLDDSKDIDDKKE